MSSADTADTGLAVLLGAYLIVPLLVSLASIAFLAWQLCRQGTRNGQTFGKQIVGIRVVRADGRPVNLGTVFMRHVLIGVLYMVVLVLVVWVMGTRQVSIGVVYLVLFVGPLADYLWPLRDDRCQALHDKLAHTFVILATSSTSAGDRPSAQPSTRPSRAGDQ